MAFFLRFILIIVIGVLNAQAKQYNIIVFSSVKISNQYLKLFKKRFPKGFKEKQEKYYVLKIAHLPSYKIAKTKLKKVKKYYPNAFIVNDTSSIKSGKKQNKKNSIAIVANNPLKPISKKNKKVTIKKIVKKRVIKTVVKKDKIQTYINQESPSKPIKLNEPILSKKEKHLPLASIKISDINNTPPLNEPKLLKSYQIPKSYKTTDTKIYDILNLHKYILALFNFNDDADSAYYQKKIDYILTEIKKDRYGFDLFINGYIRTGQSISTNGNTIAGNGGYTNAGIGLNANKLLYDGNYGLINHTYDILYKRLADITELNAKERLSILGTSIYTDMFLAQEELNMYKKILKKQEFIKQIVDEKYKKGESSIIDHISAQSDYVELKRLVLNSNYKYLHSDFILRHSIKSKSQKPFKLYPAKIDFHLSSLATLQRSALKHSSDIALQSNLLKIKETNLLSQERRYYPTLNFNSNIGYGLNRDNYFDLSNAGKGAYWSLGLTFKIPIYNRKDIILSKQREKYNILKQKSLLSSKQRDILIRVERSYNELQRIKKQKDYILELTNLADKKLKILTTKYIQNISSYKDYSDALKNYLKYKNQFVIMEQNYIKEKSILSILIGKRKFYE